MPAKELNAPALSAFATCLLGALLIPIFCLLSGCRREFQSATLDVQSADRDVLIVGGGLAGLSAAAQLGDRDFMILEKEERLGGRVWTLHEGSWECEMGALMAWPPHAAPVEAPGEAVREDGAVGFSAAGKVILGATPGEVTDRLSPNVRSGAEDAFFSLIHPGSREQYVPVRRGDWANAFRVDHYRGGNGSLVAKLEQKTRGRVELGALVESIEPSARFVKVNYRRAGEQRAVTARTVIVTTPAPVAAKLLGAYATPSVRSVQYAPGITVCLGMRRSKLANFRYVVTNDQALSTVVSTTREGNRVLNVYYAGKRAAAIDKLDDAAIVAQTVQQLGLLGLGTVAAADVGFSAVARWQNLGTVIRQEPYAHWSPKDRRPHERVFLAGDYTVWDGMMMPYGMGAALASGATAAAEVDRFLETDSSSRSGRPSSRPAPSNFPARPPPVQSPAIGQAATSSSAAEPSPVHRALGFPEPAASVLPPLTSCAVYELTAQAPSYMGRIREGTVAPYGILLATNRDPKLATQLWNERRDGLWEYGQGYGTTSADSALVIEGLLLAGRNGETLVPSLRQIADRYYDPSTGGIKTVLAGRASYWQGASVETTAHVAYLMHRVAPRAFAREIDAAVRFVGSAQRSDGLWEGRWYASTVMPTFQALRLLARVTPAAPSIDKATEALRKLQRSDGSIGASIIESALAALAWDAAKRHPRERERAVAWLRAQQRAGIGGGEPFLYYWFDHPRRVFLSCTDDDGKLAAALAARAIRGDER